jgi:hypothetical protein
VAVMMVTAVAVATRLSDAFSERNVYRLRARDVVRSSAANKLIRLGCRDSLGRLRGGRVKEEEASTNRSPRKTVWETRFGG